MEYETGRQRKDEYIYIKEKLYIGEKPVNNFIVHLFVGQDIK